MQRCSHEPLWERLMTLPPSNLDLICIQHSARFVVTFPSSCAAFATSLLSKTWMSCIIFGLISVGVCPPRQVSLSVVGSSVTVSLHSLSWLVMAPKGNISYQILNSYIHESCLFCFLLWVHNYYTGICVQLTDKISIMSVGFIISTVPVFPRS